MGSSNLRGKFKIALVVRRHAHDRARAVTHQNVIGDPDGDPLVAHRIDRIGAGENAGFFLREIGALEIGFGADLLAVFADRRRCSSVVRRSTSGFSGASTM